MTTTFASFEYPKFLADLPKTPLQKRLDEYKKDREYWAEKGIIPERHGKHNLRLNGYRQDQPGSGKPDGRMFYLDSDFMPSLRWTWCDEVNAGGYLNNIKHKGWFTDEYGDSDTIRGIVFRLPHGRGFIPGWSMGESMCGEMEYDIYEDELECAHAADSLAERIADKEREYQYVHTCHECYDYFDEEPLTETNDKGEPICKKCIDKDEE